MKNEILLKLKTMRGPLFLLVSSQQKMLIDNLKIDYNYSDYDIGESISSILAGFVPVDIVSIQIAEILQNIN